MKKSNVYTRTGDKGETSLVGGTRVPKNHVRVEAYGTVDELNSLVGLLHAQITSEADREQLVRIQGDLFSIGSQLATEADSQRPPLKCITQQDVAELEHAIDVAHDGLPGWRGFTLPGGSVEAAQAHVCRCAARRAERRILDLADTEAVDEVLLCYINRLSDYFYVLALRLNYLQGKEEILWKKRGGSGN